MGSKRVNCRLPQATVSEMSRVSSGTTVLDAVSTSFWCPLLGLCFDFFQLSCWLLSEGHPANSMLFLGNCQPFQRRGKKKKDGEYLEMPF